jgi:hypothetical protein
VRNYRAQFPVATPAGYYDEPAEYFFDTNTLSAFNVIIKAGQQLNNIALVLQNSQQGTFEYDFVLRAIQVGDPQSSNSGVGVRFRDPLGNYISSDYEPMQFYFAQNLNQQVCGFAEVNEPELWYPAGAVFFVDLANLSQVQIQLGFFQEGGEGPFEMAAFPIVLKGVHRFPRGGNQ